ncbi:cytochrome P450 [Xylariaceae sp. AK1471]|nr:cytochrome P450 [Xylariaceae sp. AK1471]
MGLLNLDLGQTLAALCFLVVGYYLTSTLYQWHRLRHIPGPFFASFSYFRIGSASWNGKQYEIQRDLGQKYGPLVRIGPNDLSTDDPEIMRRIDNPTGTYSRSGWYDGARFTPDDAMFTMVDPVKHDKLKAKVSPGYSGRETPGLETAIDEQIAKLVGLIRRKYVRKPHAGSSFVPLELNKVMPLFTLDIISRIALGEEFGCLEADKDVHGFYHIMEAHMPLLGVTAEVPWVRKIVYSSLGIKLVGPKPTDKSGIGLMMKMVNTEARKRYSGDVKDLTDVLGSFRRHGLTQSECEAEALFMFVAGAETAASVIRITLLYILATPVVYRRLKAEIETAIKNGRASSPITGAEAKELPYLQAVMYEGLRIRPAVTAYFGKQVPPEGDTIHGYFIPGGTSIGKNMPSMLRSKTLFGEDADVFRPERFLEADEATRTEMQRNVDLSFGYGRWMCAGKYIAWLELNKTYFELLREFDFQILDPKAGIQSYSHGVWLDRGMLVGVTESDMFA